MPVYMKIDGIDGESQTSTADSNQKQWIDVLSMSGDIVDRKAVVDKNGDAFIFVGLDVDGDGTADEFWAAEADAKGQTELESVTFTWARIEHTGEHRGYVETTWKVEEGESYTEFEWTY